MKRRRLDLLKRWLESPFVSGSFNMGSWPHCAIGEASRIEKLHDEGLYLDDDGSSEPVYREATGVEAVASFFGIRYDDADRIFGRTAGHPKTIARLIGKLLKRG